jgi:hypothetical protein
MGKTYGESFLLVGPSVSHTEPQDYNTNLKITTQRSATFPAVAGVKLGFLTLRRLKMLGNGENVRSK